jgi:co-chaperonin GroES (HSP10)
MSKKVKEAVMEELVKTDDVNFDPNVGKILLRPSEAEKKTKAGVYLQGDTSKVNKTFFGRVIAVGEGVDPRVKPGVELYYGQYAGIPTNLQEGFFLVMDNKDWLGIVG